MKYNLRYRGNFSKGENGEWDYKDKWDYDCEAQHVISTDININIVSYYTDSITISLNTIPSRIDLVNDDTIWILDKESAENNPEPYKSISSDKSITIWEKDNV
jgi:hypothetical protein